MAVAIDEAGQHGPTREVDDPRAAPCLRLHFCFGSYRDDVAAFDGNSFRERHRVIHRADSAAAIDGGARSVRTASARFTHAEFRRRESKRGETCGIALRSAEDGKGRCRQGGTCAKETAAAEPRIAETPVLPKGKASSRGNLCDDYSDGYGSCALPLSGQ